jgi:hypothetical protein
MITYFPVMHRIGALMIAAAMLSACASVGPAGPRITLPALPGWFAGKRVYYITTEITDQTMARKAGLTYAPRLSDAIPEYPKPPEVSTVLERVYKFPGGEQDAVFASAPVPLGPESANAVYSPLWLAYMVQWKGRAHVRELTSEEAILAALHAEEVTVERTDIVINCPIVWTASGGVLPHSVLRP